MGTLAAIALFTTAPILRGIFLQNRGDAAFYQQLVCSGLLAILAAPYAMWTVRRPHNRLDKPMGDWSYIVYLFHGPVIALYMAATDGIPRLEKVPILAAVLCFIAGGTWVIWRWFDREIDRRREIFVNKRRLSI